MRTKISNSVQTPRRAEKIKKLKPFDEFPAVPFFSSVSTHRLTFSERPIFAQQKRSRAADQLKWCSVETLFFGRQEEMK